MVSVLSPFRAIGGAIKRGTGAAFTFTGKWATRGLTLIPYYLQNLLWLLSQRFLDLARDGFGSNSAVYACLRLLSQSVPEPPLIPSLRDPDGEPGKPLEWNHPLRQLIRHPNDLMTEYEFWELTTLHCGIVGRSTWYKERDRAGRLIALWPLRPDRVGPIYSDSTDGSTSVIAGWSYLVPGTTNYIPIRREDIVLFNLADPAGESGGIVEGLGPLQVLASEVGADNEATRFVGAMLANYGQPGMVIHTKNQIDTQEDIDIIKAAARQEFGGVKRGAPAVLDADSTITLTGFNMQQLEFPALRKVSESRISAAFGVPAVLAQLLVGIENGQAYAALEQMREFFAETTLANYWRRFSDVYTRDVAEAEFDEQYVCAFDTRKVKALQHQARAEIDRIQQGFQNGAVTLDEFRDRVLGLPPIGGEAGNARILPRGAIVVDADGEEIGAPPPPLIAPAPEQPTPLPQQQPAKDETEPPEPKPQKEAA